MANVGLVEQHMEQIMTVQEHEHEQEPEPPDQELMLEPEVHMEEGKPEPGDVLQLSHELG